jgi:hypothetical protein
MVTVGVIINSHTPSQQWNTILPVLGRLINETDISPMIFCGVMPMRPIIEKVPIFSLMDASGFDGITIANDLSSAHSSLLFPNVKKRYFYMWDLEWLLPDYPGFHQANSIYTDPRLTLISRHQNHYNLFKQCWKTPELLIEDFNYEEIYKLLQ